MTERSLIDSFSDESQSPAKRYMDMFVGRRGLLPLLKYELVTGVLGSAPGALGYFLRAKLYPRMLAASGQGNAFGRSVVLRSPGRISMGSQVIIDDYVVLDAKGAVSHVKIGDQVLIGRYSVLSCNEAIIEIGDFVSIGPYCHFANKSKTIIGSNVAIGSSVQLMAGSHDTSDPNTPIIRQPRISEGIVVGDGAWLGANAVVLDGVTIGDGAIVGTGSVVSKDVPPGAVVLGNPARVIQNRQKEASA